MVVEVPRWTNAKLEISRDEMLNPIKQDTKNNQPRFVRNCFPHHGYIWNYGALPQTWESPNVVNNDTKAKGDNDPLDLCEIGEKVGYVGEIKQVKILGVMALIDDGETDWKVICIDINDHLATKLNNIEDVEIHLPGLLRATNEWFRIYKLPDGKKENKFAFSGEAKNKQYAINIIKECNEHWKELMQGKIKNEHQINLINTTLKNKFTVDENSKEYKGLPQFVRQEDTLIDKSIDKWFYFSGANM